MRFGLGLGLSKALGGESGDGSLSDVVASTVFDLDATQAASYTSGQTWANLVTAPADGAGQTDYDFYLGATSSSTTDDPTFNGSAGDNAAYFSLDGGDLFSLIGSNTELIRDAHKTTGGKDFWFALAGQCAGIGSQFRAMGTRSAGSTQGFVITGFGSNVRITQRGDTNDPQSTSTGSLFDQSGDNVLIVSHSHSTNTTRFWVNSTTKQEIAHTFNTTTTDATSKLKLGVINSTVYTASGTRFYSAAMGNAYIDDEDAAAIIAALEARHSRDYTP